MKMRNQHSSFCIICWSGNFELKEKKKSAALRQPSNYLSLPLFLCLSLRQPSNYYTAHAWINLAWTLVHICISRLSHDFNAREKFQSFSHNILKNEECPELSHQLLGTPEFLCVHNTPRVLPTLVRPARPIPPSLICCAEVDMRRGKGLATLANEPL